MLTAFLTISSQAESTGQTNPEESQARTTNVVILGSNTTPKVCATTATTELVDPKEPHAAHTLQSRLMPAVSATNAT